MDKSIMISGFADEIASPLEKQIEVLKKLGVCYIEMRGVNGKSLVEHSLDEVREIKKQLDANGIKISSVGSPIGKIMITDDFEDHFQLYKKTVEIAKILETPNIRMFSFYIPRMRSRKNTGMRYSEELKCLWIMPGSRMLYCFMKMKKIFMAI